MTENDIKLDGGEIKVVAEGENWTVGTYGLISPFSEEIPDKISLEEGEVWLEFIDLSSGYYEEDIITDTPREYIREKTVEKIDWIEFPNPISPLLGAG